MLPGDTCKKYCADGINCADGVNYLFSATMASAVCPKASHISCTCLMVVEGHPTHILKQVWPPSFVEEKKERPEAMIRDLLTTGVHSAATKISERGETAGRGGGVSTVSTLPSLTFISLGKGEGAERGASGMRDSPSSSLPPSRATWPLTMRLLRGLPKQSSQTVAPSGLHPWKRTEGVCSSSPTGSIIVLLGVV